MPSLVASAVPARDPMLPVPCVVKRTRRESHDTVTLEIAPPDGRGFPFRPGQFNMLYAFGIGESAISISGDASRPETLVHTLRAVGAVTEALTSLKAGGVLGVRGPYGRGWPIEKAEGRDLVVIAGGIGLAPLRPVIYEALARRERFGHVSLLFGARSPEDLLFTRELARWRGRMDAQVEVTVDRAGKGWRGDVGVVTALLRRVALDPARTTAMLCGPEIMMRYAMHELAARGVAERDVYLTLERNMKCAVGFCGHCQLGPAFLCKDGPVFRHDELGHWLTGKEL